MVVMLMNNGELSNQELVGREWQAEIVDIRAMEQVQIKRALAELRRVIIAVDPLVMVDGRFEEMITTPLSTIHMAARLLEDGRSRES